jgi:hypothetical protein
LSVWVQFQVLDGRWMLSALQNHGWKGFFVVLVNSN